MIEHCQLTVHGCERRREVVGETQLQRLRQEAEALETRRAGARAKQGGERHVLNDCPSLAELAKAGMLAQLADELLGKNSRPVRSLYFDKNPEANWKVPWHQDLTITVAARQEAKGFGPWSEKDGAPHVQPPAEVLDQMVALRLHLDDCPKENGALRVLAGTHRLGKLGASSIQQARHDYEQVVAEAKAGDVIAMRPLVLHASSPSTVPARRRVFHVEYAALDLPTPLAWAESV